MSEARRKALDFARSLDDVDAEVYVTAPGARIEENHPLVAALEEAHAEVFGELPQRDVTRWFSDASVLTRYGVATALGGFSTQAQLEEIAAVSGMPPFSPARAG